MSKKTTFKLDITLIDNADHYVAVIDEPLLRGHLYASGFGDTPQVAVSRLFRELLDYTDETVHVTQRKEGA